MSAAEVNKISFLDLPREIQIYIAEYLPVDLHSKLHEALADKLGDTLRTHRVRNYELLIPVSVTAKVFLLAFGMYKYKSHKENEEF